MDFKTYGVETRKVDDELIIIIDAQAAKEILVHLEGWKEKSYDKGTYYISFQKRDDKPTK